VVDQRVTTTIDGGVADVRLNRPEKLNALDDAMFEGILAAAARVASDASVRVVVLSGEGNGFCAGLDMSLFAVMAERSSRRIAELRVDASRAVRVWTQLEVPVIAAVHGVALGGGFQLALGADLRIVSPDAQLGALEIGWGIAPDMCGTQLLPPLVGPDVAKELMMTGRLVSGEEALRLGLATRVAPDPHGAATDLAAELVGRNPDALRVVKQLVDLSQGVDLAEGLRREFELTEPLAGSVNQLEAMRANLEGRSAHFDR
jgi:enoyl-CoA hydratase/carnithine racemase